MTPEEARRIVDRGNRERAAMETILRETVQRAAPESMLAIMTQLIEMVCETKGPNFAPFMRKQFYAGVFRSLRERGVITDADLEPLREFNQPEPFPRKR